MLQLLDECPYVVQTLFWMAALSGTGWGVGLLIEKRKQAVRRRVREQREPAEAHR